MHVSWEIYTIIGITAVTFTSLYTALGKMVENPANESGNLSPQTIDKPNTNFAEMKKNECVNNRHQPTQNSSSHFIIQCYQMSLGISVPKLPQSTSTRY